MKDEIKEILELFGSTDENVMFGDIVELNSKQSHLLLDYITNLQEENKKLEEETVEDYIKKYKVLEYIEKNSLYLYNRFESFYGDINMILKILYDKAPQDKLYRYTPEKGFELVGDDNE